MEYYDITRIEPAKDNPKTIRDANFLKLITSIRKFPQMLEKRPLVCYTDPVTKKLIILGGNQRFKAAQECGLKEIPVELADDWTEEQRKEFMIRDNVISGEWDWKMLDADWNVDDLKTWGLKSFEPLPETTPTMSKFEKTGKRGVMVDFEEKDYEEAFELIKYYKERNIYIGQILVAALKDKKGSD